MLWKMKFKVETEMVVQADNYNNAIEKGYKNMKDKIRSIENLEFINIELNPTSIEVLNEKK